MACSGVDNNGQFRGDVSLSNRGRVLEEKIRVTEAATKVFEDRIQEIEVQEKKETKFTAIVVVSALAVVIFRLFLALLI